MSAVAPSGAAALTSTRCFEEGPGCGIVPIRHRLHQSQVGSGGCRSDGRRSQPTRVTPIGRQRSIEASP